MPNDAPTSLPKSWIAESRWQFTVAAIVVAAPTVGGLIALARHHANGHKPIGAALLCTAVLIALALWIVSAAAPARPSGNNYRYFDPIVGKDGRISTSKTVMYLWTFELAAALTLLAGIVIFSGHANAAEVDKIFGTGDWNAYLLLLGGPFAAAVIAKGITSTRAAGESTAKTSTADAAGGTASAAVTPSAAKVSDTLQNDDGSLSLPDTQYVIFSLVAMAYFFGAFISNVVHFTTTHPAAQIGLPAIPSALLGLTSLAALTYVGNKAAAQAVRVASLDPVVVAPGDTVTAKLVNVPADITASQVWVTASSATSVPDSNLSSTVDQPDLARGIVTFTAPNADGVYQVVVHTGTYVTSPMTLTVKTKT